MRCTFTRSTVSLGAALVLAAGSAALAQNATIATIPRPSGVAFWHALAVSRDGGAIAGSAVRNGVSEHFVWSVAGGYATLPPREGLEAITGVSNGGAVVVGRAGDLGVRWTAVNGWEDLEDISGGDERSGATEVSAGGSLVVGYGRTDRPNSGQQDGRAVSWASPGSPAALPSIPGEHRCETSAAWDVSSDGAVIAGEADVADPDRCHEVAVLWSGGGVQPLGFLPGDDSSAALGISGDGQHIVGISQLGFGDATYFLWSGPGGMRDLGAPPDGLWGLWAEVAPDGSFVAAGRTGSGTLAAPWVWTDAGGWRLARDWLEQDYGMDLSNWGIPGSPGSFYLLRIADDGRTLIGQGVGGLLRGSGEIFKVMLDAAPCPGDFNGDGEPTVSDFSDFRAAYLAGDAAADYSGDGELSVADFSAFRSAYLAGCP